MRRVPLDHSRHFPVALAIPDGRGGQVLALPADVLQVQGRIRQRLRAFDAGCVARTLGIAGLLSLNRATLVPGVLGPIVSALPEGERGQFAGYLDPLVGQVAFMLAAVFLACGLIGRRRPLLGATVALGVFIAASAPLVVANPVLIGGGNVGRVVMLLLLLRALANAMVYHVR